MRRVMLRALVAGVGVWAASPITVASADDVAREKRVDGMNVFLGVVPSELIAGNPGEASAHGGVPIGRGYHHVLIALFDSKTGQRITDVELSARVEDVGRTLSGDKKLEAMIIGKSVTFGNFFFMPGRDPYSIHVKIDRHMHPRSEVTFHYRHL